MPASEPAPQLPPVAAAPAPVLRAGCHLLRLTRTPPAGSPSVRYDGTLRVELGDAGAVASGDLYVHGPLGAPAGLAPPDPDPAAGIPIFPRSRYRYYVRVTGADAGAGLGFELHRFDHATNEWTGEGAFSAGLERAAAPPGFPSGEDFLRGEVVDARGEPAGELTVGWVSPHLRRAVVEVDRVEGCEPPLANSAGLNWRAVFEQVGWDLTVVESDADLPEPSGEGWSPAELHAAMLALRESADLDSEWRYRLLCVRRLDGKEERGLMFDRDAADSNNVPREAAAIAAHWPVPDEDLWGLVRGMRFGLALDPYFRTAVHELGHAMGLTHNTADNGFMCSTDVIAGNAVPPERFPENVLWSHERRDRRRLRHLPDVWVRPGGAPFGASTGVPPALSDDAVVRPDGLRLETAPLLEAVPIGAPVRVSVALRNDAAAGVPAPAELSLKSGHLAGSVIDPSGRIRSFRSVLRRTERHLAGLGHGETRTGSLTLLRGAGGPLFPMPGPHVVEVRVEWELDGAQLCVAAETSVMVLPAVDRAHAETALRIMNTPDAVLTLALGGDHLDDGIAAVRAALENEVLRPHFAFVEAKRLASAFLERAPDLAGAADLIDAGTVMSPAELDKAARLCEAAAGRGQPSPPQLVAELRARAEDAGDARAAGRLAGL
jgi:hypothetical protein